MMTLQLGICYEEIYQPTDIYTNKIGGLPDWSASTEPLCRLCGRKLLLVLQMYCPLMSPANNTHRNLYVFVCSMRTCSSEQEGWLALRCLKTVEGIVKKEPVLLTEDFNWEDVPTWEDNSLTTACTESLNNDLADVCQNLQNSSLGNEPKVTFTAYYVNVISGYICSDSSVGVNEYSPHTTDSVPECSDFSDTDLCDFGRGGGEKYEATKVMHGDLALFHFKKNMSKYPEHIIRYDRGGMPLNRFATTPVPSRCDHCGAQRLFEMQLMPFLCSCLWTHDSSVTVDFVTASIYTCEKDCWESGNDFIAEQIIVEFDDLDPRVSEFFEQRTLP